MKPCLLILVLLVSNCHSKLIFELDPYDEIACDAATRPRILEADPPGVIYTPDFNISAGNLYPPNSLCEWQITQNGPGQMELSFLNFSLESSEQCKNDYVEVYDDGPSGDLVGRYCGQTAPIGIIRESGDIVFVRFESDDTVEYPGFLARYGQPTVGVACESGRPQVMTADNGTVNSPDWPADYGNDITCEWKFEAQPGFIFDGDSPSAARFGAWSGTYTLPPRIISSGQDMYMSFTTDFSVTYSGFLGIYTQVEESEAREMKQEIMF